MKSYGLATTRGQDRAELFISEDRKTLFIKTSCGWRVSRADSELRFAIGSNITKIGRGGNVYIPQLGEKTARIHEGLSALYRSEAWQVSYGPCCVKVHSPVPLSDAPIKEVWTTFITGMQFQQAA